MHKPKIILIRPNYYSHLVTPPLGLGYLSSYLKQNQFEVLLIDGLNKRYSLEKILSFCKTSDLVGISCLSSYFSEVVQLSRRLKEKGCKVVVGGPQATALPQETLKETQADFVVMGEGELTFLQLAQCLLEKRDPQDIPGIFTGDWSKFKKREFIQNLDSLPFPDWQQLDPRFYQKAPHGGLVKSFPAAPIISSRGCPFDCSFCASPYLWEKKIRFRSPENVVDEIAYLKDCFGVKEIHFEDDNLTLNREHAEKICQLLLKRKIKIFWAAPNGVRVDAIDRELLSLMKKSGCYFLAFGIESTDEKILQRIKKGIDLDRVAKVVHWAKSYGIITQGFFIFGLPGETKETIRKTIRFAKSIPLDKAQFLILDVLAGSRLWNELKDKRISTNGYRSYQEAVWIPEDLTKQELERMHGYAFRSFFFRPRQLWFFLRYFRLTQIPYIFQRIKDFNILSFR